MPTVVFAGSKKAAAEGVSADGGVLRFTTGSSNNKAGKVWTLDTAGAPQLVGDTYAYEKIANPDGKFDYGFLKTPKSCLAQLPKQVPAPTRASRRPTPTRPPSANGVTYVADAGANAVVAISPTGVFSTVAALKPVKVKVTPDAAQGQRPALVHDRQEVRPRGGPHGHRGRPRRPALRHQPPRRPGGPDLGAQRAGAEDRPGHGQGVDLVDGLLSPTGVAVASNGDVYVAQLFMGIISRIKAGSHKVRTYVKVPMPAAVEATPTGLLATINALPGKKPKGQVITITP